MLGFIHICLSVDYLPIPPKLALPHALDALIAAGGVDARKGEKRSTALIEVASIGELAAVQKLLSVGANVDLADVGDGVTAAIAAASNGHFEVVKALVQATPPARVDLRSSMAVMNEYGVGGASVRICCHEKKIGVTALRELAGLGPSGFIALSAAMLDARASHLLLTHHQIYPLRRVGSR